MRFLRGSPCCPRCHCPLRFSGVRAAYPSVFVITPTVSVLPPSPVQQNYNRDCEAAINSHVQLQLHASYVYLSMGFDSKDGALQNLSSFFLKKSHECTVHAEILLAVQNQRGGHNSFSTISKPERDDWLGGLLAMENAFQLELTLNQSLVALHLLATSKSDAHLCDFLQIHFLSKQAQVLKEMSSYITTLRQKES
ncbi:Ferritin heavy chain [Lemmus lemmus]